jgi:hypothetical protein
MRLVSCLVKTTRASGNLADRTRRHHRGGSQRTRSAAGFVSGERPGYAAQSEQVGSQNRSIRAVNSYAVDTTTSHHQTRS